MLLFLHGSVPLLVITRQRCQFALSVPVGLVDEACRIAATKAVQGEPRT